MLADVSKGLVYLHNRSSPIIHRDLSATNILLNSAMVAKISDLGNSRIIDQLPDVVHSQELRHRMPPGSTSVHVFQRHCESRQIPLRYRSWTSSPLDIFPCSPSLR